MYTRSELKKIFPAEEILVVLLCRLWFKKSEKKEVLDHITAADINFNRLYEIISVHGIRPFIYKVITDNQLVFDINFTAKLKDHFAINNVHSFEKLLWLKNITEKFRSEGIHVIPLKGVLFATEYYGHIALRESSDIDFLVSRDDVQRIERIINEYGFKEKMTAPAGFMKYYKKHFKEVVYVIPSDQRLRGYTLEIHWRLLNKYMGQFPSWDFFKKAMTTFSVDQLHFEKLTPHYDFLTLISNHFVKDLSVKFKYLIDVACLIRQHDKSIDTEALCKLAAEHHCTKKVELGLSLTKKLLGVELKNWKVNTSFPDKYSRDVLRVPLVLKRFLILNATFMRRSLALQDNNKQKLLFLYRCFGYMMLPTHNDIRFFKKLPLFMLFALRPFRLIGKQLRKTFGV